MRTVSTITPKIYQEYIMRLFVKDDSKFEVAKNAFNKFCEEKLG